MNFSFLIEALNRQQIAKEKPVPLAFSGGPDSVFLAYGLLSLGYLPLLIYLNYHDSPTVALEEKVVCDFAAKYELKLYRKDVSIDSKFNFENSARIIRYSFFHETLNSLNTNFILTAHHKNDDAETLILQKQRGNLVEYYGLKEKNTIFEIDVIRPLLQYSKKEIVDFLQKKSIPYYDDPTNYELTKQRNRLRESLTDNKLFAELAKKTATNAALKEVYAKIAAMLNKREIQRSDYNLLSDEEKKRLLYAYLQVYLPKRAVKEYKAWVNRLTMRLKSWRTFEEPLAESLAMFGTKQTCFIAKQIPRRDYSYLIDRPGLYRFPEVELDLRDPSQLKVRTFPIYLENAKKNDIIATSIKQKHVTNFLKKHQVPLFLQAYYPVIKDAKKNIFYVPFYSDLLANKLAIKLNFFTLEGQKGDKDAL